MRTRTVLAMTFLLLAGMPAGADPSIVELDVSFEVVNKNDSLAPCPSDGNRYQIVGTLVAPASELQSTAPAVTVYLSTSANLNVWRLSIAGYDHAAEMATLGHASLALDQLGYGRSDIPHGKAVCMGSLADMAAQVAEHLRNGTYTSSGAAPAFARIVLGRHVDERERN